MLCEAGRLCVGCRGDWTREGGGWDREGEWGQWRIESIGLATVG